ncbi:hypothetical protein GF369_02560 [Candidatus Peregrinibacteria bacterium]|nr:hypothetical protein [Candidatus Peregrinibacteria bacterium]
MHDVIQRKYGSKIIRKRTPLSQEIRKAIVTLMFGLVLITVVLSIVFLLNTSNSAQKGYVHSQLILQNEELDNINKELRMKVMEARSMVHLEETDKIDSMTKPGDSILIDNENS